MTEEGGEEESRECDPSDFLQGELVASTRLLRSGAIVRRDIADESYTVFSPLSVGSVHKGYIAVRFDDPYGFFNGNILMLAARFFLPALGIVLLLWLGWHSLATKRLLAPYLKTLFELQRKEILGGVAAQVAHDIRSPIAALDSVLADPIGLPPDEREVVRIAMGRIRKISDNLLDTKRNLPKADGLSSGEPEKNKPQFSGEHYRRIDVLPVLEGIIHEKRAQYRGRPEVRFELFNHLVGPVASVLIQPTEFMRVLSNLLNNAVEASPAGGEIQVILSESECDCVIQVKDHGKGISAEILARLNSGVGGTFGKELGNGLGVRHARLIVDRSGGNLSIVSRVDVGTTVEMRIPLLARPSGDHFSAENSKVLS